MSLTRGRMMDRHPLPGHELHAQVPADADLAHITPNLRALAVLVEDLAPDPRNAMTHPERNLAATVESLRRYGQRKPLVANLRPGAAPALEAGSGTLEAARRLGWRYIAVVFQEDDERTARGFGVADNRTAQLAAWDEDALATWAKGDEETARAVGFDDNDLGLLLGDEAQPEIEPWDMAPTRDRFVLTISGTLPLEAEVRRRLRDLPGEVQVEVSTLAL